MATRQSPARSKPKYLYAFINGSAANLPGINGIMNKKVHLVRYKAIAAVVSEVKNTKVRPQRRNLAAHQHVLTTLLEKGTPLPVAFGIVAENNGAIKKVLSDHREDLEAVFERVHAKVEMGLRVVWGVPNIFEYFADTHAALRQVRDRLYSRSIPPAREDKIELGSLFDRLLDSDRDRHATGVEAELAECCTEIKRCKCRDEHHVMNLACLVPRGKVGRFEEHVLRIAGEFDNNFSFDIHGPWVPHNFVDLRLEI